MHLRHVQKWVRNNALPRLFGLYLNVWGGLAPGFSGWVAMKVFTRVRGGRLNPSQQDRLGPARYERERIEGHLIQIYRWPGDGPKVLLVHGWQSNSARWKNLLPFLLEEGFDVYAFDAPGHGNSSGTHLHVPLFAEIIGHLRQRLDPEILVGHSVGGMAILYDLFLRPSQNIRKIVSLGAPARFSLIMDEYQRVLGLSGRVRASIDRFVLRWLGRSVEDFNCMEFAAGLETPGLLIHDIEDDKISYQASVRVHQSWEASRLVLTRGYGHSMHVAEVNDCVRNYLCDRPLNIRSHELNPDSWEPNPKTKTQT